MTFKKNIGTDARVFYTQKGGLDSETGLSLETAKLTIQGSVDAVNALTVPPNAFNRAAIIVGGSGFFSENLSFVNFTSMTASGVTNAVATGTNYILASFSSYSFGLTANSGASEVVFDISNEVSVSLACTEINVTGSDGVAISVSGTTDDTFCRVSQLRLLGAGSIGINYTATNGEPEVFLLGSITLEDDNTVGYIHDPSSSTARAIFDCANISDIGSPTGTTAIRIIDGHLTAFFNEINSSIGLDVQGGTLSVIGNCLTGDITVAVGATLNVEITEFSGTITNNGTIIGRIGDEYFSNTLVTTSDTLTSNFLVKGDGGTDINLASSDDVSGIFTDTLADELTIRPTAGVSSSFHLQDSAGVDKLEFVFADSVDVATIELAGGNGNAIIASVGNLFLSTNAGDLSISSTQTLNVTGGQKVNIGSDFEVEIDAGSAVRMRAPVQFDDDSSQSRAAVPGDQELRINTIERSFDSDLSAEITVARGNWMSPDGLKLYVGDNTTQSAFEYDLSIPFDLSTITFSGNSLLSGQNLTDFFLKPDGTSAYFMTFGGDFREFPLSTPFDLSTAGTVIPNNTTATTVSSVHVGDNGTDLYFLQDNANNGNILQFVMTTPWDFSTLGDTGNSFVSGQADGSGLWMAADRRSFMVTSRNPNEILQFAMSDPADITTAYLVDDINVQVVNPSEICISSDAKIMFLMGTTDTVVSEYQLGVGSDGRSKFGIADAGSFRFVDGSEQTQAATENAITGHFEGNIANGTLDVSPQLTTAVLGLYVMDNGIRMFASENDGGSIFGYDLTTPWDVTSAVFSGNTANLIQSIQDLWLNADGTTLLTTSGDGNLRRHDMTTPFDLTTTSLISTAIFGLGGTINSFFCSKDGRRIYANQSNGVITQFDMGRPFDPTALINTGNSISLGGSSGQAMWMKDDGKILYQRSLSSMLEFILTTPWDISTAILDRTTALDGGDVLGRCFAIKSDGSKMFLISTLTNNRVDQYDLGLTSTSLTLTSPDLGTSRISFNTDTLTPAAFIQWDDSQQILTIDGNGDGTGDIVLNADAVQMIVENNAIIEQINGSNAISILRLLNSGTNGANIAIRVGSVSPVLTVMGNAGDEYHFQTGINSTKFINKGATNPNNTGWTQFLDSQSGVTSVSASLTNNFMVKGDGANEIEISTLDDVAGVFTDANNEFLNIRPATGQTVGFVVDDSSGAPSLTLAHADSANLSFISSKSDLRISGDINISDLESAIFHNGSSQSAAGIPSDIFGRIESATQQVQTFSVSAQDTMPNDVFFREDGIRMYVVGDTNNSIFQFNLTVAWDISTASFIASFSVSTQTTAPNGLFFRSDGTSMFVMGVVGTAQIHQYSLAPAWDITSAVFVSSLTVSAQDISPASLWFRPDGERLYFVGRISDDVFSIELLTPWDISTSSTITSFAPAGPLVNANTILFRPDGQYLWILDLSSLTVFEYYLTIPWDITTSQFVESVLPGVPSPNGMAISTLSHKWYTVDESSADIHEFNVGISVNGEILVNGNTISVLGTNEIEIFTAADLDALAVAGVITISTSTTIILRASITTANRFVMDNSSLRIQSDIPGVSIVYVGTGDFFSGDGLIEVFIINLISASTGTLLAMVQTAGVKIILLQGVVLIGWDDLGSVNGGVITLEKAVAFDWGAGFVLTNMALIVTDIFGSPMGDPASGSLLTINGTVGGDYRITNGTSTFANAISFLNIDAGLPDTSQIIVTSNEIGGLGTLFDITGSITGTFTAVADAAVASTAVTSVTDSGGVARFNFTVGPTVFVNQEITTSAFIVVAYNVTGLITATGAGFFEIASIPFSIDDTGNFAGNSITLTDTTTALVDGNTLVIDTDTATDYDGGAIVYNQLVNSFQINRTFTVTQTGSWDSNGIDQSDPRVLANLNPGFIDSKYIATAFVNNNATANGAIVNNTFTDLVFGTVGTALVPGTTIERWKLIDELNGTFEYTGNEPFSGLITFDFTVASSGGTVDFRFKWQHDVGAGFVDLPDNVESLVAVGGSSQSVTKTFPLSAVIGDQIKPQITRNSGTSGITTQYASIFATQ